MDKKMILRTNEKTERQARSGTPTMGDAVGAMSRLQGGGEQGAATKDSIAPCVSGWPGLRVAHSQEPKL